MRVKGVHLGSMSRACINLPYRASKQSSCRGSAGWDATGTERVSVMATLSRGHGTTNGVYGRTFLFCAISCTRHFRQRPISPSSLVSGGEEGTVNMDEGGEREVQHARSCGAGPSF
jgi:hypothetical protein